MYALEAFLSLIVVLAYVNGIVRGRNALDRRLRDLARCDGLRRTTGRSSCASGSRSRRSSWRASACRGSRRGARRGRRSTRRGCRRCSRRSGTPARRGRRAPSLHDLVLASWGGAQRRHAARRVRRSPAARALALVARRRADRSARSCSRFASLVAVTIVARLGHLVADLARPGRRAISRSCSGRCVVLAARAVVRARRLGVVALVAVALPLGRLLAEGQQGERARR